MSHQHKAWRSPCRSHLRSQRVSMIYRGCLITLYLCLQMVTGEFRVKGPNKPLVATLGDEAKLYCFLLPPQNVKNMKISWTRSLPSQVVHLYEDGRDKPEEAMDEYFRRTVLVTDDMDKGVVILRIFNVQHSDGGQYRCAFQHGSFYGDAVIELNMAVLGSNPHFHVQVTDSGITEVVCKSEGWFPQPQVQWLDSEGEEIPAESSHIQHKRGMFHVTTSLSFREPFQQSVLCSVWNPLLKQKKEQQLFIAAAEHDRKTVIAMSILLTLLVLLASIANELFVKKWLKNRHKNRRTHLVPYALL
ncbi:butyrophilin subfamily 1 member A1-like [Molossus nigricans]